MKNTHIYNYKSLFFSSIRLLVVTLVLVLHFSHFCTGANKYWVGGTGNWSDGNNWRTTSGGSIVAGKPNAGDNAIFDANSFTAIGQQVILTEASVCLNMSWVGAKFNPTLAGVGPEIIYVYGSLTLINSMKITTTCRLHFVSYNPGNTVKFAGQVWPGDILFGFFDGGGWTLLDSLSCRDLAHGYGTLNTGGNKISCATFDENYTTTRTLILGSSLIKISGNDTTALKINSTGLTLNAGTSTIMFTGAGTPTLTFTMAHTFNNIEWTNSASKGKIRNTNPTAQGIFKNVTFSGNAEICGNNKFNGNLTLATGKIYSFEAGKTQTFGPSGNIISSGNCMLYVTIQPIYGIDPVTFSKPTALTVNNVILNGSSNCIIASGGTPFIANNSLVNGCVTNWTVNHDSYQTADLFWFGESGNWDDPSHWSTISGIWVNPCNVIPGAGNNVFFNATAFSDTGQTVTVNATANCRNMKWTGAKFTPKLDGSQNLNIYGSLTMIYAMNISYTGQLSFTSSTTGNTITTAGQVLPCPVIFGAFSNPVYGIWTLNDSLVTTNFIGHYSGTLNTNNNNIRAEGFSENATVTRTLDMGSSTVTITGSPAGWNGNSFWINATGLTLNAGTSTIKFTHAGNSSLQFTDALTFYDVQWTNPSYTGIINNNNTSNNGTFNNVTFAGDGTINGNNTINGNLNLAGGKTYTFQSAKTQTFGAAGTIVSNGSCGNMATIKPSGTGVVTFSRPTAITVDYVYLNAGNGSITATGGIPFIANSSTSNGNVSNWTINYSLINASHSGSICPGTNVTFSVAQACGGLNSLYQWRINGSDIVGANSISYSTNSLVSGDVISCRILSPITIVNGDFESGNTGFSTSLTYSPGDLFLACKYDVAADPSLVNTNPDWISMHDHTTGSGNMFIANGTDSLACGTTAWEQIVDNLMPGKYEFGFWSADVDGYGSIIHSLYINDQKIGGDMTNIPAHNWASYTIPWFNAGSSSAKLQIRNRENTTSGNDFAIDDITLIGEYVDSMQVSIWGALDILSPPADDTIYYGAAASFSVTCLSAPALHYQWQLSTDGGGTWANQGNGGIYNNMTTATMNISSATVGMNHYQFRCAVSDTCGSIVSNAAILNVLALPVILIHPQADTVFAGGNATYYVVATNGPLTYQWQVSSNGGANWQNILGGIYSGYQTDTLTLQGADVSHKGFLFRCEVSNVNGSVLTNATELKLFNITGTVTYGATVPYSFYNPLKVTSVFLYKSGDSDAIDTALLSSNSTYTFNDLCPGNYYLGLETTMKPGGINATDALMIQNYVIGLSYLRPICQYAAETRNNTMVSSADALNCKKYYVHMINSFPTGDWVFSANNPGIDSVKICNSGNQGIYIPNILFNKRITSKDITLNIDALSMGDVNGSRPITLNKSMAVAEYFGAIAMDAGEEIELPVFLNMDAECAALSLSFEYPGNIISITDIRLNTDVEETDDLLTAIDRGRAYVAWTGSGTFLVRKDEPFLKLKVRLSENMQPGDDVRAMEAINEFEMAGADASILEGYTLSLPLLIAGDANERPSFAGEIVPNPLTGSSVFRFVIPESGSVSIDLFDVSGRFVRSISSGSQEVGYHTMSINSYGLQPGVYNCRIIYKTGSSSNAIFRKVVVL